jgi:hypothetical protein
MAKNQKNRHELEIALPTMGWEQIDGDMDPGKYGGTIATADGRSIELIKIQPVREYVGDTEAKDVGFPFWTKEIYFSVHDLGALDPNDTDIVKALKSVGISEEALKEDFTPTQRGVVIAVALLEYVGGNEGPAGWSDQIGIPDKVKWSSGKVAGSEYLADEDDEFRNEILLGDIDVNYESYGPDEDDPTSSLKVLTRGHTVEITEWTDIEAATGDDQPEGEKISKQYAEVELDELFNPKGKHRGSYSGDHKNVTLVELADMDDAEREKAIVAAAIAFLAYHGGEEEFVDEIGD